MFRKLLNSSLAIITSMMLLSIAACGSESDMDHDIDWSQIDEEIEYRMDNVDLQPTEEVEIEFSN